MAYQLLNDRHTCPSSTSTTFRKRNVRQPYFKNTTR